MKVIRMLALAALCSAALPRASTRACSLACLQGSVFPASGPLPANAVKLRFAPGGSYAYAGEGLSVRLSRLDGANKVSVPFTSTTADRASVWITPTQSLPVGTVLVLDADPPAGCQIGGKALSAMYTITAEATAPMTLGSLSSTSQRKQLAIASDAPCSETIDAAVVDLTVQLTAEAQPYAALIAYQLIVDGQPHDPWSSFIGGAGEVMPQGQQRLFAGCARPPLGQAYQGALSLGTHTVHFQGTLPDGSKLNTPDVTITLKCESAAPLDAGTLQDAGSGTDAALITGGLDAGSRPSQHADDGCSLAYHRSGVSGLLVGLALLLRRRRTSVRLLYKRA